jgi:hypothetical protein
LRRLRWPTARYHEALKWPILQTAHNTLTGSLVCVLVLAVTLAVAPADTLADIRDGLIAKYRFDESAGSIAPDFSGHRLHGKLEGAPQ